MDAETTRRDVGAAYAPFDPAHAADPYAFYARARREAPVFYSPAIDAWVVSSYATVVAVLKDHWRFATAPAEGRSHTPEVRAILASTPIIEKVMLSVDPPSTPVSAAPSTGPCRPGASPRWSLASGACATG